MNKFINLLKSPRVILLYIFFSLILLPIVLVFFIGDTFFKKIIYFFFIFFVIILITDFIFLFLYRLFTGYHYKFLKKIDFNKMAFEPHPYLPYIYKKKFKRIHGLGEMSYPLNKEIKFPGLLSNNMGHYNGDNGDRDVKIPKPNNLIRINCVGGSTTGNYIKGDNNNHSYPLELERMLKRKFFNKEIEVNNCGQGGNNSADILVRFVLQGIDTKPDYLIIYHGYNDIRSYLTPSFSSDYFHSRKNLGEVYWKYYAGSKIPNVRINFINYCINKYLFPFDERSTILESISKNKIDINQDYTLGLQTYERNIQNIINLCLNNKIKVILSTFCIYLYPKIKNDPLHQLYQKIVFKENEIMKKLAKINNLILADPDSYIEKNSINFLDSVHLSIEGMKKLANCFVDKIELN